MNHIIFLAFFVSLVNASVSVKIGSKDIVFYDNTLHQRNISDNSFTKKELYITKLDKHLSSESIKNLEKNHNVKIIHISDSLYYVYGTSYDISSLSVPKNATNMESSTIPTIAKIDVDNKYENAKVIEQFPPYSSKDGKYLVTLNSVVNKDIKEIEEIYKHTNLKVVKIRESGLLNVEIPTNKLKELLEYPETLYVEPTKRPISNGNPMLPIESIESNYIEAKNIDAAHQSNVSELWYSPYNLTGIGVKIGIVDGGKIRTTHQEFQHLGSTRVIDKTNSNTLSDHATHVAGTIGARGVIPSARGMANLSTLYSYSFYDTYDGYSVLQMISDHNILLSNHSYGVTYEWAKFNNLFGYYDTDARDLDAILHNNPYHIFFKSAGNERASYDYDFTDNWSDNSSLNSWGVLSLTATAKNIITIAAADNNNPSHYWLTYKDFNQNGIRDYNEPFLFLNPTNSNYSQENLGIAYFSNPGPTRDGRIKPDLAADGYGLYSSVATSNSSYSTFSGTSMSSPTSTGITALIIEQYKQIFGQEANIRSDLLKAILVNTAIDAGKEGPDYEFGYGYIDAKQAIETIRSDNGDEKYFKQDSIENQAINLYSFSLSEPFHVKATLAWIDLPGNPANQSKILINDLDLTIESQEGKIYYPWSLSKQNPSLPATNVAKNSIDNLLKVEKILPAGDYVIKVHGYDVIDSQNYAIAANVAIENGILDIAPIKNKRNYSITPIINYLLN